MIFLREATVAKNRKPSCVSVGRLGGDQAAWTAHHRWCHATCIPTTPYYSPHYYSHFPLNSQQRGTRMSWSLVSRKTRQIGLRFRTHIAQRSRLILALPQLPQAVPRSLWSDLCRSEHVDAASLIDNNDNGWLASSRQSNRSEPRIGQ